MDGLGARDLVRDDSYRDGGDVLWNRYAGRAARRLVADDSIV